jgi:uncharacterized RDD family membrane protein YckC
MEPAERPDGLVVATPERVAFEYTLAGLGSRFMAQAIDLLLLLIVFFAISLLALLLGSVLRDGRLAFLFWLIVSFALFVLYFPILEGVWSGQTPGKRLMHIRVLGERGEPVTLTQVAIRNLIRLVDFLPVFYGVGIITLFVQGGSKRLGDFAAGTVVVRDRERIGLKDLVRSAGPVEEPSAPAVATSIWADRRDAAAPAPEPVHSAVRGAADPYEDAARRMPAALRRFVVAYAGRRHELAPARRQQLAQQVASPLAELLPAEVAAYGAMAILEGLASLLYAPVPAPSSSSGLPPPSSPLPPKAPLPPAV